MVPQFVWICLGGAAGTGARYLVSGWAPKAFGIAFPYGTLIVNFAGSLLLGGLMHVGLTTELLSPTMRSTLTVGVMGGFTTYSTFSYETLQYLQEGAFGMATLYVALTLFGCLGGCAAGFAIARWLVGG
jgi:CrcB protein